MYKFIDEKGQHCHTFSDKPLIGTTTLIKEVHPPMLSWYGSGKACEYMGWQNPKNASEDERLKSAGEKLSEIKGLTNEDYLAMLDKAYRAHDEFKKKRGKEGTNDHAEVEDYIKYCIAKTAGKPLPSKELPNFSEWAIKEVKKFLWSEGYCYSEKLWVGGCADFGFISKDNKVIIGDRKTAKEIYWTNFLQCAAYGVQAKENGILTADGKKIGHPKQIDGYMIFQENKTSKVAWQFNVEELERTFIADVATYRQMQTFKGA